MCPEARDALPQEENEEMDLRDGPGMVAGGE